MPNEKYKILKKKNSKVSDDVINLKHFLYENINAGEQM